MRPSPLPLRLVWPAALLAVLALLFAGCVGVIPTPVSSNKVQCGRKLTPADVAFIQAGRTTRAEVVAHLGTDYSELRYQRAMAYSWEMAGGGGIWWCVLGSMGGGGGTGGSWTGGWRAFFIAFDDHGVVTAAEFQKPSVQRSLHEHMEVWVARLPVAPPAFPGNVPGTKPTPMLAGTPT